MTGMTDMTGMKKDMNRDEIVLEVRRLSKHFGQAQPLRDVNFIVRRGDTISIIGPSGTGKSTLLRCINRIETPSGGQIFIKGEEMTADPAVIRRMRHDIGMVFQSFNLFSNMNVLDNITLGPKLLRGLPVDQAEQRAMELLKMVGLADRADRWPEELSGGQKQRVAIARALAMEPEILLFGAPTSALAPRMVDEVLFVIRQLAVQGCTMLIVTHEMRFAESVSSRVFYMDEGVIYEEGTPEEIFHAPKQTRTRVFIERLHVWETTCESEKIDLASVMGDIADFARKQFMSARAMRALQQIFEECCVLTLMARGGAVYPVRFSIFSGGSEGDCTVEIRYAGESYDPFAEAESLQTRIVRSLVTEISHKWEKGENLRCMRLG